MESIPSVIDARSGAYPIRKPLYTKPLYLDELRNLQVHDALEPLAVATRIGVLVVRCAASRSDSGL